MPDKRGSLVADKRGSVTPAAKRGSVAVPDRPGSALKGAGSKARPAAVWLDQDLQHAGARLPLPAAKPTTAASAVAHDACACMLQSLCVCV